MTTLAHLTWPDLLVVAALFAAALAVAVWRERRPGRVRR